MYVPDHFAVSRDDSLAAIAAHPFATLISIFDGAPVATHLPLLLSGGEPLILTGHMARANPHWRAFGGGEALAIFHGPHGFISATWYEHPEKSVPTWNYVAVHAYGTPRVVDNHESIDRAMDEMAARFEGGEGWGRGRLDPSHYERLRAAIVVFEMPLRRIEGKMKLSQNRSTQDVRGVIDALRKNGADGLAEAMLSANP